MKSNVTNARGRGVLARASAGTAPGEDARGSGVAALAAMTLAGTVAPRPSGMARLLAVAGERTAATDGREASRHEALLLGCLAVASLPAVWISAPQPLSFTAVGAVAAAAGTALAPRTAPATFARGCAVLAAAALLAVAAPGLSMLAALWAVACVAVLSTRLPGDTGWLLTAAGSGMLAMLETVLALLVEPAGGRPDGVLLAGAAATVVVGTAGSAVAHRLAAAGSGWAHPEPDGGRVVDGPTGPVSDTDPSSDPLTGLGTRATLLRGITRALARADVIGGRASLFVVDVDRFDTVVERFGERGAHEALRQLARRLRAAMPAEDVVVRLGDATFAVLVEGVGDDGNEPLARRMSALLEEPMIVTSVPTRITCSIGTAYADGTSDSPERLLRAATAALRSAKTAGRGRWAHHDPALGAHEETRDGLEADLRDAVAAGTVEVVVQPVVDLAPEAGADRTGGVEVLPRWVRPDGTTVPASHFVAVADDLGLGGELGGQVLDRALDLLVTWQGVERAGGAAAPRYVAVNVQRSELDDPGFAGAVSDRLAARGLPAAALSVEVSAATFVDTEQARRTLGMLRSLGVGVAVDDFGRGPLGLVTLRQLPVDTVKVDRAVTAELGRDDSMLTSVLTLCRATGRRCVVDGVESTAQLEAARRLGVDAAQGFLLGRPAPPASVAPRHVG